MYKEKIFHNCGGGITMDKNNLAPYDFDARENTLDPYISKDPDGVKIFLEMYPEYEAVIYRTNDFAKLVIPEFSEKIVKYVFKAYETRKEILRDKEGCYFIEENKYFDGEELFKRNLDAVLYAIDHNELSKVF